MADGRRKKNFLGSFADAIGQVAGAVGEVVSSAGELLVDADLRRKGAKYIVQEASKGINEAQRGLEASADALGRSIQQGAKARFGAGARQLQSVLRNIERQVQEFQRQQQQRDLQSEIEHHHKLPVDIQIGDQVFEDMPQEMRSRFWFVLAERPDLAQELLKRSPSPANVAAAAQASGPGSSSHHSASQQQQQRPSDGNTGASSLPAPTTTVTTAAAPAVELPGSPAAATEPADVSSPLGSPFAAFSSSPDPQAQGASTADGQVLDAAAPGVEGSGSAGTAATAAPATATAPAAAGRSDRMRQPGRTEDSIPDIDDLLLQPSASGGAAAAAAADAGSSGSASPAPAAASAGATSPAWKSAAATAAARAEAAATTAVPRAPSPWTSGHNETSLDPPASAAAAAAAAAGSDGGAAAGAVVGSSIPVAPSPWDTTASTADATSPAAAGAAGPAGGPGSGASGSAAAGSSVEPPAAAGAAAAATVPSVSADGEGWEMVSRDVPSVKSGSTGDLEALDTVRTLVESLSEEATLDSQRSAKQAVFQAMLEVPWVAGEGIPDSPTDGTQYAELLAAGCGSIEEVISRDVPRTFPEHPLFNTAEGQQQLLRVLKAYAAADPEIGYCQGMAFAAGVLLMYMPEEPAFRLFQRLMSPEGPNLRRYYLPGLDHLKVELSCFELLLSSHQPLLHQHLLDAGLPALLYAAQWLMTTYACPFPVHVAARVLDVLLQSNSDAILLRMGLAVMEALSSKLLELQDFEEVITYLKVKPLSWPVHMHRKVFAAALSSAVTDAELSAAAAAAREEFARSGRAASFSSKHLARQATAGGTLRHELVPGPMGPRTLSATEAAAAMAVAAVDGGRGAQGGEGAAAAAEQQAGEEAEAADGASSSSAAQQQQQQQLSDRLSSTHETGVLVGPLASGSGIAVDDMDSLEDLITDLDLLLPGGASDDTDSLGQSMGSPGPCEVERKTEQL